MADLRELEKRLDYRFKDENLIVEALTHKSYKKPYDNERLEFLGDAVLDLIVGEYLFFLFKDSNEGSLSKLRASLVSSDGLQKLCELIRLGDYIYISLAEENNKGRQKPSLLSNAFEAMIGAIYLESGLDEAKRVVLRLINKAYPRIDLDTIFKDYKTTLQEVTQAKFGITPNYVMVNATGPDHKKVFEVAVEFNGKVYATAKGNSKKSAQQIAAKKVLEMFKEGKIE
jgi:ribonuclease-3